MSWCLRLASFLALLLLPACYNMRPSTGGGQTSFSGTRPVNPNDVAVPAGYRVAVVATGFVYPTGVAFASDGTPYVTESGYSYGEDFTSPRLIRVNADGSKRTILNGGRKGPWTGVVHADGAFYIAEGGQSEGGRILRVTADGA